MPENNITELISKKLEAIAAQLKVTVTEIWSFSVAAMIIQARAKVAKAIISICVGALFISYTLFVSIRFHNGFPVKPGGDISDSATAYLVTAIISAGVGILVIIVNSHVMVDGIFEKKEDMAKQKAFQSLLNRL